MRLLTEAQLAHVSGSGSWGNWESTDFSGSYEGNINGVDVTIIWGGSVIAGVFPILAIPGMIWGAVMGVFGGIISSLFPQPGQQA
ncbi:hypothetical protein C7M52_02620 [Mixta theicola]|nr:hypothetical protein [Mixta theicola]QHM76637.1 hypothetical protein C7M52_02620 [Mixta theicola]